MTSVTLPELRWYIVKVQTNREASVRDGLQRAIALEGMQDHFGRVVVPTDNVIETTKTGGKRTRKEKLFPGYILLQMRLTDEAWYLVRKTGGVGDFAGAGGVPTPMSDDEVSAILDRTDASPVSAKATAVKFENGARVKIRSGAFEGFDGVVEGSDSETGDVQVSIEIFGRPTPISVASNELDAVG